FGTQLIPPGGPVEYRLQDQSALPAAHASVVSAPSAGGPEPADSVVQPFLTVVPHIDREHELAQKDSSQTTTHEHVSFEQNRYSTVIPASRGIAVQEQNRKRMLQRLHRTYEELFAQSLHGVTYVELGLADKPDAVQSAVTLLFQSSTRPKQILPPGTSILQVY